MRASIAVVASRQLRVALVLVLACGCDKLFSLDDIAVVDANLDANVVCPGDYNLLLPGSPGSHYKLGVTQSSWLNAATECRSNTPANTHLVVISNDVERLQVANLMPLTNLWIGLDDRRAEGAFVWVTSEPAPVPAAGTDPWSPTQPDNQGGNQNCVRIEGTTEARYNDEACDGGFAYVCECDRYADAPTRY